MEKISHAGKLSIPDEWLKYAVEILKTERHNDLLHKYLTILNLTLDFLGCSIEKCRILSIMRG